MVQKTQKTQKIHKTQKRKRFTSYKIHDNGGRPYVVDVYTDHIDIIELDEKEQRGNKRYETAYDDIWIGDNGLCVPRYVERGKGRGNSILVRKGPHRYLFIGQELYWFDTKGDTIQKYYSPIGNNDVPYPYAVGEHHTYFLLHKKKVSNSYLDPFEHGYDLFYRGSIPPEQKKGFRTKRLSLH